MHHERVYSHILTPLVKPAHVSMLQGIKYGRRWVDICRDTLVYARTHSDMAAGNIQVFAMHELAWVRKEGTAKFVVRLACRPLGRRLRFPFQQSRPGAAQGMQAASTAAATPPSPAAQVSRAAVGVQS